MKSYPETVQYLYDQLPMFQRVGDAAVKKDLTNTIRLCHVLGHPHRRFDAIHVAGTNGKGSVSHLLASLLQAAGLKVGLYTSPHYLDYRERIKINGEFIAEDNVVDFVQRIRPGIDQFKPSFFELTVAMAFDFFCREKVDVAVVETGLGGRLDSTNILSPRLAVITNIGLDHQQYLGDTLEEIAEEKAGIIKRGTPVVIGTHQPVIDQVFMQKAKELNAPIHFAPDLCSITGRMDIDEWHLSIDGFGPEVFDAVLGLAGPYQLANVVTSLGALKVLREWLPLDISLDQVRNGLKNVRSTTLFMGRWQWLSKKPKIMVDSAHNEDGIRQVFDELKKRSGALHVVFGVVGDKDLSGVWPHLPKDASYYFCAADLPRSLAGNELHRMALTRGLEGEVYSSVGAALEAAIYAAGNSEDLIFVGGSSFVVAEALEYMNSRVGIPS